MWAKILKAVLKYGSKAIAWAKKNWRWLVELAIDIIIDIIASMFG